VSVSQSLACASACSTSQSTDLQPILADLGVPTLEFLPVNLQTQACKSQCIYA